MAIYSEMLATMVGRIQAVKPNARQTDCRSFINDRIRRMIDRRIFWADLLAPGVVAIPDAYVTGVVAPVSGSAAITGTGMTWPVSDLSNTTIVAGVLDYGYQEVTPVSMAGISTDSLLYVDAANASVAEVVSVIGTSPTTFTAKFSQFHGANCTVTQSSLAGRQMKFGGNYAVYTIRAITGATAALLDNPWGSMSLTGCSYQIVKAYYTVDPYLKDVLVIWDPVQGIPLRWHIPLTEVTMADPQRTTAGDPIGFVDHSPMDSGSMQYEIWPHQTVNRQLQLVFTKQWPELINPTDRPPWFINPGVIVDGATADALCINNGPPPDGKDPFFNPKLAERYEAKYEQGVQLAINSDESRSLQALTTFMNQCAGPAGANWNQTHVAELYYGEI